MPEIYVLLLYFVNRHVLGSPPGHLRCNFFFLVLFWQQAYFGYFYFVWIFLLLLFLGLQFAIKGVYSQNCMGTGKRFCLIVYCKIFPGIKIRLIGLPFHQSSLFSSLRDRCYICPSPVFWDLPCLPEAHKDNC